MQFLSIQRLLGVLLALFSTTMIPPMVVSWYYEDGSLLAFLSALLFILCSGLALWLPARHVRRDLRVRDGFIVVVMFWTALGLSGSLPLMLADRPHMPPADAVFESISGLTTTGATVITGIDGLPKAVLFYRQLLQWLGGMGIIVLAVAVLPMLGIGGMQLYRAETPGPLKDNKLTPRITETAKALWYIYLGLTVLCTLGYLLAGMDLFDAISHSFSTVAIGGFSTHDESLGYFDSPLVEMVAVVFMFLAGINFALHFMVWRARQWSIYLQDSEFRFYTVLLMLVTVITSVSLFTTATFENPLDALRYGLFQTVSIATTTGFTTHGYYIWPGFLPVLLLFASFVGGCAGSVGGGLKVIRVLLLLKQGGREIMRLIHPNAEITIKVGGTFMPYRVMDAVWGFFAAYVGTFCVLMLGLMATGLDQITAFSAVAACMNNLGPGLGDVGAHYGEISDSAKWLLCAAMLLGRLEVFTVLVILSPAFWRS
ncbi:MAG: TrkH family potassium uptake protein [Gammaproteobacteria bacterium]|nr:TrkH family potassium uptake protein [Gammaproteobacteria bacterium]